MKYNKTALAKFETLIKKQNYRLIYEKGSFESGSCIVHEKRYIVLNKFKDLENTIKALIDILDELEIDFHLWSNKEVSWYYKSIEDVESNAT